MTGHERTRERTGNPKQRNLAQVRPPEENIITRNRQNRPELNIQEKGNSDRNAKGGASKVFGNTRGRTNKGSIRILSLIHI